jgi:hypothetical protein
MPGFSCVGEESIGSLSAGCLYIDGPLLIQGLFSSGALESIITVVLPRGSYGRETIVSLGFA